MQKAEAQKSQPGSRQSSKLEAPGQKSSVLDSEPMLKQDSSHKQLSQESVEEVNPDAKPLETSGSIEQVVRTPEERQEVVVVDPLQSIGESVPSGPQVDLQHMDSASTNNKMLLS